MAGMMAVPLAVSSADCLVVVMVVMLVVLKDVTSVEQMDVPMVGNLVDEMAYTMVASWVVQKVVELDDSKVEMTVVV